MLLLLILPALAAVEAAGSSTTTPRIVLRLRDDGSGERDFVEAGDGGRLRTFHGTNMVVKGEPWLPRRDAFDPLTSLVAQDYQFLQDAGINLIRLGVMWAGAEPVRGQYNETYFAEVRAIVQEAAEHSIYVLLDMHQDVLSEHFCGEGIPGWAVDDSGLRELAFPVPVWLHPAPHGPDGFPSRQTCDEVIRENPFEHGWAVGQGAFAAGAAYNDLYTNRNNLTEAWGAFWARTAAAVSGLSNVLGFELLNEPFAGNPYEDPLILVPGMADAHRLQPAYDTVVRHIRSVDQESLIFFAAVPWDDDEAVGFTAPPGGPAEANRSVLAYHYYTPPQRKGSFPSYLDVRRKDAVRLGTGLMMTESCCGELFDQALPSLEGIGHSWIQWEWKDFCQEDNETRAWPFQRARFGACKTGWGAGPFNNGSPQPDEAMMARLAVPYATAVAGMLSRASWDAVGGVFELELRPDGRPGSQTEIFVNERLTFPSGFEIEVQPAGVLAVERQPESHRVLLTLQPNATVEVVFENVTVRIFGTPHPLAAAPWGARFRRPPSAGPTRRWRGSGRPRPLPPLRAPPRGGSGWEVVV